MYKVFKRDETGKLVSPFQDFEYIPGKEYYCQSKVEIDQFKRRYERIKLIRQVPNEEVKELALALESKVGYKLSEALFPVNLMVKYGAYTQEKMLKSYGKKRGDGTPLTWALSEPEMDEGVNDPRIP
jgi:hypothetical protein